MSLLVSVLFFNGFVKVLRGTEDVVHNREGSVRFFISNIFEMAWIHYITSFKRQKKGVFCNIIHRFRSFLCFSIGMLRKEITF